VYPREAKLCPGKCAGLLVVPLMCLPGLSLNLKPVSEHIQSAEIFRARLDEVRARIADACSRASRNADHVTVIGVTKTFPADVVRMAASEGLLDFGENRVQELAEKAVDVPGRLTGGPVRWHLIGPLQRNKARRALELVDSFHALDSERLATDLDRRAGEADRRLDCFVQVNVSGEDTKAGLAPAGVHDFIDRVAGLVNLRIVGLMTLASPVNDPENVRPEFRMLRRLRDEYAGVGKDHLRLLSMGMSSDFEVAVEEGATHVRIGSLLFGPR
jgi:PLP dependent protein